MMSSSRTKAQECRQPGRPLRGRRWWRWVLAGLAALAVLALLAVWAFVRLQPAPAALTLPAAAARPAAGTADGTWHVAGGSLAGFRVHETALGASNDAVGRTSAVSGDLVISGDQVTSANFRIDLTSIRVNGKTQPQVATSLATGQYPDATFTLTRPAALATVFTTGAAVSAPATGWLTLHGSRHLVTFTVSGRRDGAAIEVAGSIPIAFSDWGISGPASYGMLGSLASHGVAEFLLVLNRG